MNKPLKIDRFSIHYHNKEELLGLKAEIFSQHSYYFESRVNNPKIIDAGAHVGLATLYFKKQYPLCQITALEPNPLNFKLLEQNVWENDLSDVTCLNVALADTAGDKTLYQDTEQSWLSTSSFHKNAWNGEQSTQPIQVEAITLSSLLTNPIDLVKLDIEGAELAVLKEARAQLHLVKRLFIECHPHSQNNTAEIAELLRSHHFQINFVKNGAQISEQKAQHGLVIIEAVNNSNQK